MVRGANMVTDYGRIGKAKTTENRKSYVTTVYVLRRAADWNIPTRCVSEGQFRPSLTYVSGYDW